MAENRKFLKDYKMNKVNRYSMGTMEGVRGKMEFSMSYFRGGADNQGKEKEKKKNNSIVHFIILFFF